MRYRRLGRSGLEVSEVALGSWLTIGSSVDQAATHEIVRSAVDLGINLFDTADVYARGAAELALREALSGISRHHVVLATKAFFPMSDRPWRDHSGGSVPTISTSTSATDPTRTPPWRRPWGRTRT
jgi:aryl-alcohol dehydrogenase-like predicted oxidoreductase